jgi:molybdate transport system substrate-binding protein
MKPALDELGPQFERSMGHKLTIAYESSGGMKRAIDAGEPFDVAIVTQTPSDDLVKPAKMGTPIVVARCQIHRLFGGGSDGRACRADRRSPRYRRGVQSQSKAAEQRGGVDNAVADGTAELGFSVISAIRATQGVELVGPLPPELQEYVVYSAAVGTAAKNTERSTSKSGSDPK